MKQSDIVDPTKVADSPKGAKALSSDIAVVENTSHTLQRHGFQPGPYLVLVPLVRMIPTLERGGVSKNNEYMLR